MAANEVNRILNGAPYHVGICVTDVGAAMAEYGAVFGFEWADRIGGEFPVKLRDETRDLKFDAVYSKSGPVHVELTVCKPNTIWTAGIGLHHIGFWSDDVVGQSRQLAEAGYPVEAELFPIPGSVVPSVAFCRGPQDIFIELVSSDLRAGMEASWL